ncbi:PREDICTED: uncharacterized protein LOC104812345 isoform X2 [Tarenaya hassleriana]|uniref:uncharacterized protein LOC104812345 isoform X1 n=1 Tax=Tarenaya hassleriana TaxID=28532 RepID=UPI00053C1A4C|nr:PREDICTED: uncharacterized protein LOC104812345 isoform X1 [Tarenaya hassleriana]XP_010537764.1 PREDICTED: uncharacterized protein LOC104812345 isoform X2 [Tarenaya hassleriana]
MKKEYKEVDVGQGELYSPEYAIKISTENPNNSEEKSEGIESTKMKKGMVVGLKNLSAVKDKVIEKLAAAAVPSETLENARQFLEGVVREVATTAHGLTKDALHRIKTHLVDILPSLSPVLTRKMVDDAEKEADGEAGSNKEEEGGGGGGSNSKEHRHPFVSPTSSFFGSLAKPFSRL